MSTPTLKIHSFTIRRFVMAAACAWMFARMQPSKWMAAQAVLARPQVCMECGACQLNCITSAIHVESGVGCASAMIQAALKGQKEAECSCG